MPKALVIEDSATSRLHVTHCLQEEGWEVIEAEDGERGVELAREHRPAVIVCDLLMPRCNGYQVCRAIRGQGNWLQRPRIIVMTASDYAADRANAKEAGADDYLVKPIQREALREILATVSAADGATPDVTRVSEDEDTASVRIRFWGVRGSLPTPGPETVMYGGNTSCVEVRAGGEIIIFDAGTGIRKLGQALGAEFKDRPMDLNLLITHTHWDHIQGFPFFLPAYNPANRLRILGVEGALSGLETTLSSQMESPYFPISMQQLPGNIRIEELKDMHATAGNVEIAAKFLHHPGICVGYRLSAGGVSVAYITDHEPFERFLRLTGKTSPEDTAYAQEQDARLVDFIDGADILIIDSQYDAKEYANRVGWGHGCVDDVVEIALRSRAKRLFLFHHDPDHSDQFLSRMVDYGRELVEKAGGDLLVDAAREGSEVTIPLPVATAKAAQEFSI